MKQRVKTILFIGLALIALFGMTGCPQAAKPEEPPAPPEYTPVAHGKLKEYIQNLPAGDTVHKIEVTGLKKEHLNDSGSGSLRSILHFGLNKKVALKLPKTVEGLTDMSNCFLECENLVSVANIPSGVTDMRGCFEGCIRLKTAPVIPYGVLEMSYCFKGCTSLTSVTLKCNYNDGKFAIAFKNCTSLSDGSIKVPASYYNNYTAEAALNAMEVPGDDAAAKKAKFAKIG